MWTTFFIVLALVLGIVASMFTLKYVRDTSGDASKDTERKTVGVMSVASIALTTMLLIAFVRMIGRARNLGREQGIEMTRLNY